MTRRINNKFKKFQINRELKYSDYLGCTPCELKIYLQNRFIDNMSYDNYPEWEIDHIIPIDSFDLQNLEKAKKCFNYNNLQPLWKKDNRKKSNKIY